MTTSTGALCYISSHVLTYIMFPGFIAPIDRGKQANPVFFSVNAGDYVVVAEISSTVDESILDGWVAHVICCIGGARDAKTNSLFQVSNIDTGVISTINADLVKGILKNHKKS